MDSPLTCRSDAELARLGMAAFDTLYQRHNEDLLAFALARFRGEANDIVQTTWLKIVEQLQHGGREMTNFRGYLFTIVRNRGIDPHRGGGSQTVALAFDVANPNPSHEQRKIETESSSERGAALTHCYEILKSERPDHAAAVEAWLSGERPEVAAKRLAISRPNFDQRKKRALTAIKECVEKRLP